MAKSTAKASGGKKPAPVKVVNKEPVPVTYKSPATVKRTMSAQQLVREAQQKPVRMHGVLEIQPKTGQAHFEASDYEKGREVVTRVPMAMQSGKAPASKPAAKPVSKAAPKPAPKKGKK